MREKLKVLHLGKFCPPSEGGIEVFTNDLLKYLNRRGIRADLLCFNKTMKTDKYNDFIFYACETNFVLRSAPLSLDFLKTFLRIAKDYDIIHVHSPNPLAEILSLFISKKLIIHWHSDITKQKILYQFYKPIQQLVLKKADKIICTSSDYLKSSFQIKNFKKKTTVIPLGIDTQKISFYEREKYAKSIREQFKNRKIILSVGRLVEYKGFEFLILAGKFLKENTAILIAGNGPLFNKLNNLIKQNKLENRVFLLGRVENVYPLMRDCDIFCLPSITRNEAFGLVLAEALYFGKPLLTTHVDGSGMNYVNQEGVTGLTVPTKDPHALAVAIEKILGNESLYLEFSKNSKDRFKEFDLEKISEKILEVYEEMLLNKKYES